MEWELLVAISIFPDTHTPEVLYLLITSSNMEWELLVAISTSRYSHNGSALFIDNVIKYGVGAIGRHKHFPDTHTPEVLYLLITSSNMEWELLVAISTSRYSPTGSALFIDNVIKYGVGAIGRHKHFPDTHTPEVLYSLTTSSNTEWELLVAISTSRYSPTGSALFIDNVIKYGVGAIGRHKHFPDTHTPEVLYSLTTSSNTEWELLVAISTFPDTHTPEVLYLLITSSNMEWELLVAISIFQILTHRKCCIY